MRRAPVKARTHECRLASAIHVSDCLNPCLLASTIRTHGFLGIFHGGYTWFAMQPSWLGCNGPRRTILFMYAVNGFHEGGHMPYTMETNRKMNRPRSRIIPAVPIATAGCKRSCMHLNIDNCGLQTVVCVNPIEDLAWRA